MSDRQKNISCRNCVHGKVWHQDEGRCYFSHECACEAWEYGVNVASKVVSANE